MRYVKIEGGLVVNATSFESDKPDGWDAPNQWVASDNAQIGWTYDGSTFAPPPLAPEPAVDLDQIDTATLNGALVQPGSVLRALASLTLQEINALRTRAGLAAYTQAQFVAALKARMR